MWFIHYQFILFAFHWPAFSCKRLNAEAWSPLIRDEVSVSTSPSRDGLETWFWLSQSCLSLRRIWDGLVSVSKEKGVSFTSLPLIKSKLWQLNAAYCLQQYLLFCRFYIWDEGGSQTKVSCWLCFYLISDTHFISSEIESVAIFLPHRYVTVCHMMSHRHLHSRCAGTSWKLTCSSSPFPDAFVN